MFNVPATISLFLLDKPIFSNLVDELFTIQPSMSYFIGEFKPGQQKHWYYDCINRMMEHIKSVEDAWNVVVNNNGHIMSIGEIIGYDIIRIVQP